MTQDPMRIKLRLVAIALCSFASYRLYGTLARIVPHIGSAEPTRAGEVFPWVPRYTHETLASIQRMTHGFSYAGHFIACGAALFGLYALLVWLARPVRSGAVILAASLGPAWCMARLLCVPAMLSSDTYAYAYYGRLLSHYGVDAHSPAPAVTLKDPFLAGGWYQFVPSVYGPLWTVISGAITAMGGGRVGFTLMLFHAFEIAATLGSGALIWLILKRLSPDMAASGTLFFLWNPLVIFESGLGGHNDAAMMFFALLALWLHLHRSHAGAVVALTMSALIKVITAPLVPLYILMLLRRAPGWKERARIFASTTVAAVTVAILSVLVARMNTNGLIASTAGSAQFFENNYHELLFKGLRRLLGEQADTIEAPMDFHTYWVAVNRRTPLHAGISNKTPSLGMLPSGQQLLAISDEDSDTWLRVYDPATHLQGYVNWSHLAWIDDPPFAATDPVIRRISGWPPDWPSVFEANRIIRLVTWSLFITFGLLAAWKTRDFDGFIIWSTAFFLAAQLLVFTKIWPWYAIWPLAYGAIKPRSGSALLAVLLSAGMLSMYVLFDFSTSLTLYWVNDYRSIPAIVLPVVIFAVVQFWPRKRGELVSQTG
jgi:hypothetical protein